MPFFHGQLLSYTDLGNTSKLLHGTVHVYYKQTVGITTGLICACQLANVFLIEMDMMVQGLAHMAITMYKRYIDDVIVKLKREYFQSLLLILNQWDPAIKVTHEEDERFDAGHYLDIEYSFVGTRFAFTTYRKPQATYAYTPFSSCHSPATFAAVLATERNRLLLTNSDEAAFERQWVFAASKFKECGYPGALIEQVAAKRQWQDRDQVFERRHARVRKRIIAFKCSFVESFKILAMQKLFNEHLKEYLNPGTRFIVCHLASRNLFRLRYQRFIGDSSECTARSFNA